jgi:saccharopine dehydrogenase-like NADP-dependent oxidoreductase
MEVALEGEKDGRTRRYGYYLLDKFDEESQTTSMARCTGYTWSIVTRQVAGGLFTRKGICPPEYVGATPGCYEDLLTELAERGVVVTEAIVEIED